MSDEINMKIGRVLRTRYQYLANSALKISCNDIWAQTGISKFVLLNFLTFKADYSTFERTNTLNFFQEISDANNNCSQELLALCKALRLDYFELLRGHCVGTDNLPPQNILAQPSVQKSTQFTLDNFILWNKNQNLQLLKSWHNEMFPNMKFSTSNLESFSKQLWQELQSFIETKLAINLPPNIRFGYSRASLATPALAKHWENLISKEMKKLVLPFEWRTRVVNNDSHFAVDVIINDHVMTTISWKTKEY